MAVLSALPGWTWDPHAEDFQQGLEALKKYVAREGHSRVPTSHSEAGFPLGRWVTARRFKYRAGRLTQDQVHSLESMPDWTWDAREAEFRRGLRILETYALRTGHARVPGAHHEEGFPLGQWVTGRRSDYRQRKLTSERIAALEAISGWCWDVAEADFIQGLEKLRDYVGREGHARVPQTHEECGHNLGKWVNWLRVQFKKGKLPPERIAALEATPGWTWEPRRKGK